jgi:hypothetical protein
VVSGQVDTNYDGRIDYWTWYDGKGRPTRDERDLNFDGEPDAWSTYRKGVLTELRGDSDFDGVADFTVRYEHGTVPAEVVWEPRPPTPARRILYRNGVLREELRDLDGDGVYDHRVAFNAYEYPEHEEALP